VERESLDAESADWLAGLTGGARDRDETTGRLHALLLRAARAELARRSGQHELAGPELDDLAHQAAADALVAVLAKLDEFRGESRFTTWAYKFVILEVASKLGRHYWQRHPTSVLEADDWERLPDRFGVRPDDHAQQRELVGAIRDAVHTTLTERQRTVFVALVVNAVPLDALAERTGSSRNAIYKTMFDARRKLRGALAADGYLDRPAAPAGWVALERVLETDPGDIGCAEAMRLLHVYVDLLDDRDLGATPAERRAAAAARLPGVTEHLAACGPCGTDFEGLLAAVRS
jgi:RNA polymerase sigma-70 factor, ECF subfamily